MLSQPALPVPGWGLPSLLQHLGTEGCRQGGWWAPPQPPTPLSQGTRWGITGATFYPRSLCASNSPPKPPPDPELISG